MLHEKYNSDLFMVLVAMSDCGLQLVSHGTCCRSFARPTVQPNERRARWPSVGHPVLHHPKCHLHQAQKPLPWTIAKAQSHIQCVIFVFTNWTINCRIWFSKAFDARIGLTSSLFFSWPISLDSVISQVDMVYFKTNFQKMANTQVHPKESWPTSKMDKVTN